MKNKILLGGLMVVALAGGVRATIVASEDWSVGQTLADNSASGLTVSHSFSGLDTGLGGVGLDGINVRLNLSGGYNGDLYGYLTYNGTTVVLLDRVGKNGGSTYGYNNTGFNITLSDGGTADFHNYQSHSPSYNGTGQLTGDWQTDQSGTTSGAGVGTLNAFTGDPNGTWTLFLADLSSGGQSTLVSWGLDISVVPEPTTYALLAFAGLVGLIVVGRHHRAARKACNS